MADEIDELLRASSPSLSAGQRAVYGLLSLVPVLPAAALFVAVFLVDISRARLTIAAAVLVAAAALSTSYGELALARAAAIRAAAAPPPAKAAYKGNKAAYTEAIAKHNAAIENAAVAHSIYYNNAIFLITVPFVGCYVFADKISGDLNFLLSAVVGSGLALFNSKSAVKAMTQ